jgi:hypothetical protein
VPRHEIYSLFRRELRRNYQIAFVFPVFVVGDYEHASVAGFVDYFFRAAYHREANIRST